MRFRSRHGYLRAVLFSAVLLVGCHQGGDGSTPGGPSNVILIVVDTLRADYVSAYGGEASTPNIDALAREGVRFERAYSHVPITGPSHTSLFTGLLPTDHKVRDNAKIIDLGLPLMAELLQQRGYATAGFVSLGVLHRQWGFSRGFDVFDDRFTTQWFRPAAEIAGAAIPWVEGRPQEPFFLWAHFSDPHEPYSPPGQDYPELRVDLNGTALTMVTADGYGRVLELELQPGVNEVKFEPAEASRLGRVFFRAIRLVDSQAALELGQGWESPPGKLVKKLNAAHLPSTLILKNSASQPVSGKLRFFCYEDLDQDRFRLRYKQEVEYADRYIGELVTALKQQGFWRNSIIVFTSDHGEGLGDHNHDGHIEQVYDTLLRVPLVFVAPGRLPEGEVVAQTVGQVDILPTVLELLGSERPWPMRGRSLVSLVRGGGEPPARPVISMTFAPPAKKDRSSLVFGGFKYILNGGAQAQELFDLRRDPGELVNLAAEQPEKVEKMRTFLEEQLAHSPMAGIDEAVAGQLSEEEKAQLQALGYLN